MKIEASVTGGGKIVRARLLSYGAFHILYAMQLVALQKQTEFSHKNYEFLFEEGLRVIETVVENTRDVAFYELFRLAKTTERIAQTVSGSFGPQLNFDL